MNHGKENRDRQKDMDKKKEWERNCIDPSLTDGSLMMTMMKMMVVKYPSHKAAWERKGGKKGRERFNIVFILVLLLTCMSANIRWCANGRETSTDKKKDRNYPCKRHIINAQ